MEHPIRISSRSCHARSKEKGKKKKKAQKGEDASKKESQDDKDSHSQLFLSFRVCLFFGAIVAYIALRISSLVATHKALPIRRPRDRFRTPSEFVSDGNDNLDLKRGPLVHTISPTVCEAEMHQEVPESLWPPQAPMGPPEEERRACLGTNILAATMNSTWSWDSFEICRHQLFGTKNVDNM